MTPQYTARHWLDSAIDLDDGHSRFVRGSGNVMITNGLRRRTWDAIRFGGFLRV